MMEWIAALDPVKKKNDTSKIEETEMIETMKLAKRQIECFGHTESSKI